MTKKLISINYALSVLNKVEDNNINKVDIEKQIERKMKEIHFSSEDTVYFTKEFPCEKTWTNYLIIGTAKKKNNTIEVFITDLGFLNKRVSFDKDSKIYTLESKEDGISIPEFIEQLKMRKYDKD
ncbi:hypothetical protein [Alkaliphilus sp. B6464]|uniref:hypothetical protein n=1 Tax=Alkaliphilus sp. B6464 TaxID=2731219 RepID=UPI001BAE43BD|nr:hypothetical protein [Alkaliphilus sp. B6464]QUH21972.1 hypothetical protein HYG84_18885 [Alkaliphilus sp. B6464]